MPQPMLQQLSGAIQHARDSNRRLSRQVLYTRVPEPEAAPPLTALMDQWLNPHRQTGEGSTLTVAQSLRPLAESLLGTSAVLFQDLLLVKRPGQHEFPWHQDFGFWPVDRELAVVIWVPIKAADSASGALRFAAGSHRLGVRPVVDLHTGAPQDSNLDLEFDIEDWPVAVPSYAEGDIAVFSPLIFHSSSAKAGGADRPAWSCVFLAQEVRWCHANAPNHPLCQITEDGALVSETVSESIEVTNAGA